MAQHRLRLCRDTQWFTWPYEDEAIRVAAADDVLSTLQQAVEAQLSRGQPVQVRLFTMPAR